MERRVLEISTYIRKAQTLPGRVTIHSLPPPHQTSASLSQRERANKNQPRSSLFVFPRPSNLEFSLFPTLRLKLQKRYQCTNHQNIQVPNALGGSTTPIAFQTHKLSLQKLQHAFRMHQQVSNAQRKAGKNGVAPSFIVAFDQAVPFRRS